MINPFIRATLGVVAVLGTIGVAANASAAASGDFACGVASKIQGGTLTLEGTLTSPTAISGEYRFALKSSSGGGSSNINQGGQFSAAPNTEVSLGQVMVNADAHVSVDFTVTTGGKTFDCSNLATRT